MIGLACVCCGIKDQAPGLCGYSAECWAKLSLNERMLIEERWAKLRGTNDNRAVIVPTPDQSDPGDEATELEPTNSE